MNVWHKSFIRHLTTKKSSFYISTPIYYVNAPPHIGHLYSSVIADAIKRWQEISHCTENLIFSTGTDEHGLKIQQAALNHQIDVSDYCNRVSQSYRDLSDRFDIGYTDFVRTSSTSHQKCVQQFWKAIDENGFIYKSQYEGWYCVSDETFLPATQLKEVRDVAGKTVLVSAESGHVVEWTQEENYMFRLSALQGDLKYWLTSNESVVRPRKFHKILLDGVSGDALPDVSISRPRSRVHWGVRVPGDDAHTIYVWMDALINYVAVAGYPDIEREPFRTLWPIDVHVIGKDILKFHGVYWPAFLMAAKLEPPKTILCHSHWTVDDEKMSKSKNNVVCPIERSQIYTTDGLRYFLLREGVAHSDGNYSDTKVVRCLNSELADTLGNLLSRCCSSTLNPQQIFPAINTETFQRLHTLDVTTRLIESVQLLPDVCHKHYNDYNFYMAVDAIMATLHRANLFVETLKPWELRKSANTLDELHCVLHITLETLRVCAILLQPIIPNISARILSKISAPETCRRWRDTKTLSWTQVDFQTRSLSADGSVMFKRILPDKGRKDKGAI